MPRYNLTFKTPDVLDQLREEWIYNEEDDDETHEEKRKLRILVQRCIKWDEYVYLTLDTDANTVTVKEV